MKRSEISDEYKWSVKDLYSSDELWNNDYEKALKSTQEKSSFEGCVMDSADTLADALSESEKDDYITERLYVYAFMRYYEDTSDGTYQQMSGKAQMLAVKMSEKYSFLVPEIMAADDDKVARFLDSDTGIFFVICLLKKSIHVHKKRKSCLQWHHRWLTVLLIFFQNLIMQM